MHCALVLYQLLSEVVRYVYVVTFVSRCPTLYLTQICNVKNKDIRKFLDGIYVSEKGTVVEEA